jgi:endonuclease G
LKRRAVVLLAALASLAPISLGCRRPPAALPPPALRDNDNLLLGNPSSAGPSTRNADNYLLARPQYALSYNRRLGGPNWVSWHLHASDLGPVERTNLFAPDPALPGDWQIRPADYQGSGYDRGHQCPSGDRTRSEADNEATFYMSNMLPQTPDLNRDVWRKLEEYCRRLTAQGNELYILCGGYGSQGNIAAGRVNVPDHCWKVAVVLPEGDNDLQRIDPGTRVIAVDIPNTNGIATHSWRRYITDVASIERATGLRLLSNLPEQVRLSLEPKRDATSGSRSRRGRRRQND